MRKLLCLTALFCAIAVAGLAQGPANSPSPSVPPGYWLGIEVHDENPVMPAGWEGATTYRIYMNMVNETDFLSSVSGESNNPLFINSTTTPAWYNDAAGVFLADELNPSFLVPPFNSFFPSLGFDSWMTIGAEDQGDGVAIETAASTDPGVTPMNIQWNDPTASGVLVDDPTGTAIYTLNPCPGESLATCSFASPAYAGEDLKVLVAQITTLGTISGQMQMQVFVEGDPDNEWRGTIPISLEEPGGPGCTDVLACNYDEGATEDDGSCVFADEMACESCDGNGGVLVNDADGDGVCDADEVAGCSDAAACNYDAAATDDDGSCAFATEPCEICDGAGGVLLQDADGDGVCDGDEVEGCTDAAACNYDEAATDDNGSCTYAEAGLDCDGNCLNDADGDGVCDEDEVVGCTDASACNYDAGATDDDGSCTFAESGLDCDGNCLNDADGDGVCDELEVNGCTASNACNYDAAATEDDGTCDFCSCVGRAMNYAMTVEEHAVDGVPGTTTYRFYVNMANSDDFLSSIFGNSDDPLSLSTGGTGFYNDPAATGGSAGGINPSFLLPPFNAFFPGLPYDSWYTIGIESAPAGAQTAVSAVESSTQPWIGSFDATNALSGQDLAMTDNTGGAWYVLNGTPNGLPDAANQRVLFMQLTTSGIPSGTVNVQIFENGVGENDLRYTFDFEGAGVYQAGETVVNACGCTDDTATNFDPAADYDDGSCEFAIPGCTDATACNYDAGANADDGSCVLADGNCEVCDGNGGVAVLDADGDGVCDNDEIPGCTDAAACNYDASATDEDDSCILADGNCEVCDGNGGVAILDADGDGVCDADEIEGCQDASACNYDAAATDAGDCVFADGNCEVCDGNGGVSVLDADGDGVCDADEIAGCTDVSACNYDAAATDDDGSCVSADVAACEVCDGNGGVAVLDADGDGVCDADEVAGCTASNACNYDAAATDDDGSCDYCSCAGSGGGTPPSGYSMTVEEHAVDGVPGATTYRFYVDLVNGDDFLSSVYGNIDDPLSISTGGTGFYNDPAATGGAADGVNPSFLVPPFNAFFPGLAYDSWFTIGIESAPLGAQTSISAVESSAQPWIGAFDATNVALAGSDVVMDDNTGGAWYVLNGTPNGLPDAANQRVLILQITTSGTVSGTLNTQVFVNGVGENDLRFTFDYDGPGTYTPEGESAGGPDNACGCTDDVANNYDPSAEYDDGSCDYAVFGCTDATACNYDADATEDDGSCALADGNCEVCDGNGGVAVLDADGDGVCDADEIEGCQDASACNYDAAATDAGDCVYADGNCEVCDGNGGVAVLDADGDGVCDADEIEGCQDASACNYDATATDAGDCVYADGNCEVCDGNGGVAVLDADGDGVCDADEIEGCQDASACNYDATATNAGDCVYADGNCEVCDGNGGVAVLDADGDGVCDADEIEGCQDASACNYDATATDAGDCVYADGNCEVCDGNGGVAVLDADGDGVCDADEIEGCQDASACNYDATATDAGDCVYADGNCEVCDGNGGVAVLDADGDGVCDADEIEGCQDASACNYDATATDAGDCVYADGNCEVCDGNGGVAVLDADGDGVCDADEIEGCQDASACNYDATATDAGDCVYADGNCEVCDGNGGVAVLDADGDGVCDADEIEGCQDASACNYDATATDAGDCVYADGNCEVCDGNGGVAVLDADGDGVCDSDEIEGCQDASACNYDAAATDAGDCVYADGNCEVCDGNGGVAVLDADGDGVCDADEIEGCQDASACNYDATATDAGDCVYADGNCEVCDGNGGVAVLDADGDGVCDADEIEGCQDASACNYDATATDAGDCVYADGNCEVCDGNGGVAVLDADGDGVCDADEIEGCQDATACNYDAAATDAGDCVYADGNCEVCDGNGGVAVLDADGDGVCDADEIEGCQDASACNYDATATDAGDCVYADGNCEVCDGNGGVAVLDADGDGVCDADEIEGCQDASACNYDATATDAGDCVDADGNCEVCDGNGGVAVLDADGDGVCDADEIEGCQDASACNYDAAATDAGDCVYADGNCEVCDGNGGVAVLDADGDGVCDADEIEGCQDASACNYDAAATDAGDCVYADGNCEVCDGNGGVAVLDADGDGVCDADEIAGCTDAAACNYDASATDDDGSCNVPLPGFDCDGNSTCAGCEISFTGADNYTVDCESDLPTDCDASAVTATASCSGEDLDVSCVIGEVRNGAARSFTATTAFGQGPDGAFRIYGAYAQGIAASDFFFEDENNPLTLMEYDNGVAVMTGSVINNIDAGQRFDVHVSFVDGQNADDWVQDPNHEFLVEFNCTTPDIETVYLLDDANSYLIGQGDYEGGYLQLSHMPVNEHKRFQLGVGGNTHNCEYGFGGWFMWEGQLNNAPVIGFSGDIIVDLEENPGMPSNVCGEEFVDIYYTAMDLGDCDLIATAVQTVTRLDETAPEFVAVPADEVVECNAVPAEVALADLLSSGALLAVDNCEASDEPLTYAYLGEVRTNGDCPFNYTLTRTWSVTDCSGNTTSAEQVITVQDTEAPVLTAVASDLTVECDGAGNSADLEGWLNGNGGAVATDNCGDVTWTHDFMGLSDGCGATGGAIVTFTATDECGNASSVTATFTIEDTTAPALTAASDMTVECDGAGNGAALNDWLESHGGAMTSDVCGDVVWSNDFAGLSDDCGETGLATVTFTATDACGNASFTTATFSIEDTEAPVFTSAPADQTSQCAEVDYSYEASDVCSGVTYSESRNVISEDGCGNYVHEVTVTATDACGNATNHMFTITVQDTEAPMFVEALPADMTVECTDVPVADVLTATDNCDQVTVLFSEVRTDGDCDQTYTLTRIWSVEDCSGNATSHTQMIEVQDTTAPVFNPFDEYVMVNCGELTDPTDPAQVSLMATDNCSEIAYSIAVVEMSGGCPATWSRTWTATDACGNVSESVTQFVTMFDNEAPTFVSLPDAEITIAADANCVPDTSAANTGVPVIEDNCSADYGLTLAYRDTQVTEGCSGSFSFVRTWTATDYCENADIFVQTIHVIDATAPVVTAASDLTVECDGMGNMADLDGWLTSNGGATASDACGGVTWTNDFAGLSDDCGATGAVTVTFTATDDCGNAASTVATFTIEDTTAPEVADASDLTVECDGAGNMADLDGWLNSNGGATASDVCGGVMWTNDFAGLSDGCGATGAVTVTFTATDDCGNATSTAATFTIEDTTAPEVADASDLTVECDGAGNMADLDGWLNSNGGATASDVCGGVMWTNDFAGLSDDCGATGAVTVTFTATDDCGNATSTAATFTIEDTTAPEVADASDLSVECDGAGNVADLDGWLNSNGGATASDVCGGVMWTNDFAGLSDGCGATGAVTVTFTATDDCGNATSTAATFTIEDTTAPEVADASDLTVECDGAGNMADLDGWLNSNGGATASDVCGGVMWTNDFAGLSDGCGATGAVTVTFTATDDCGNATSTAATFTIEDTTAPEMAAAMDLTVECDGAGNVADLDGWLNSNGGATASDVCGGVTWTNDFAGLTDDCGETGFVSVTFVATDDCGNAAFSTATFTIADTTAPEVADATDLTVECDGAGNVADLDGWLSSNGGATASDVCGGVTWTNDFAGLSDGCGATGAVAVTFTATDDCGNATSTMATFTVEDTVSPEIAFEPQIEVSCDVYGDGTMYATANDACGGVAMTFADEPVSGGCVMPIGAFIRTYTAIDDCGNETTVEQILTLTDETAPTLAIACPADITLQADADCNVDLTTANTGAAAAEVSDNCDAAPMVTIEHVDSDPVPTCGGAYSFTRTFTATAVDHCGNTTTDACSQTITVEDVIAPIMEVAAADVTVECDGMGNMADLNGWLNGHGGAMAVDNCSAVSWTNDFSALSDACGATGAVTVTFTATDDCGNATSTTATFTIEDTTAPDVVDASDLIVECDGAGNIADLDGWLNGNGGATAADACGGVTWMNDYSGMSAACGATGAVTVTFTATDDCGNATSTSATFTIEDTTAPEITYEPEVTIACDEYPNGIAYATTSDACGNILLTFSDMAVSGGCVRPVGEYVRTYTAIDDCGNTSTAVQIVMLVDDEAPVVAITCPADVTLDADADCMANTDVDNTGMATATAEDNCDAAPSLDIAYEDGDITEICEGSYSFIRTFTATSEDHCGNVTVEACSQTITVQDVTAPEMTTASDLTVECDGMGNVADLNGWLNSNGGATASDNCSAVTWTNDFAGLSDGCGATGAVTVTFTATDDCGNAASTVATFTIEDTTAPELADASDLTVECDGAGNMADLDGWLNSNGGATASDVCGGVMWTNDFAGLSDDCGATGAVTVTFTATDDCGNATSTAATFTIEDTTAPEVADASDLTVECDGAGNMADLDGWLNSNGGATASDVCGGVMWTNDFAGLSDGCGATGAVTVTFTATDDCGNATSTAATFTIEDTTAPEVADASDLTVECDGAGNMADLDGWLNSNGGATASDVCGGVMWTNDFAGLSDGCGATGAVTVTFTATDDCGNATSTAATFTIEDTTAPEVADASDLTVECDGAGNMADLDGWLTSNGGATASDVCGGVMWTNDFVGLSDGCGATGAVTVTFTATDDCGNATSTAATFTIEDTTAPEVADASDLTVECDGAGNMADLDGWLNSNGGATASDVCGGVLWTNDFAGLSDGCGATGAVTVTFTATDDCGNATSTAATFTIEDTTAPEVADASDLTVECDGAGNVADLDGWLNSNGGATASDVCGGVMWTNDFAGLSDGCGATGAVTVTFTATDDCGNATSTAATFTIEDTTAPEVADASDLTVECDGAGNAADLDGWLNSNGGATASDVCGGVMWTNDFAGLSDGCGATGAVTVTFTATDDCGNATSTMATFTIEDTMAPAFTEIPMDQVNECEEQPYTYAAEDACSGVTISEDRTVISEDGCGNYEHLVTLTATDACGNATSASFTIVVSDTIAPAIDDSEGVADGSIVPVCAEDIWGTVTVPEAVTLTTSDNCTGDVTVDFTETYVGDYAPTADVESYWMPMDPATMEDGLTCDNFTPHAARLIQFGVWGGDEFYVMDGDDALITNYVDGTHHLYMRVVSQENADRGWTFEIDLNEGLDWVEWTEQPGAQSYKLDCEGLGDHETWMYHILQNSSQAIGWGAYDGDVLDLTHQPSNGYYGFQIGGGANNKNANNGFSGWFYYEGTFQGQSVMGTGDVFGDIDTTLPWSIERAYTISDCSGNTTTFGYTVDVNGETCVPVLPPLGGANDDDYTWGGNDADEDTTIGEEDTTGKNDRLKVLGLSPNPSNDRARLAFTAFDDLNVEVAVYDLTGVRVLGIFEGQVYADDVQNFVIYTNGLENGMYSVRILSTEGDVITTKLMVAH